ncbi:hypothetical protein GE09DRAFT_608938 [Coniochaeta sp. 2T2.1]|nr:hypothetical protein GE09DRAFT_608938 [Coniochaeta sp. 2T2.1]
MAADAEMTDISIPPSKTPKAHTLHTLTLTSPSFAYAHLQLSTSNSNSSPPSLPRSSQPPQQLDNLQLTAYLTAALRQFLGDHGAAVSIDILKIQGKDCWVRLPRQDLGLFAAAVTAYPGTTTTAQGLGGGTTGLLLRLVGAGDWLGSVVGREGEGEVWGA